MDFQPHFNHISIPEIKRPFVEKIDTEQGHFYKTENGEIYPSITTLLRILTKDGIDIWRYKIGEEEANRISKESAEVGTALHKIIENFLKNEKIINYNAKDFAIDPHELFTNIKPALACIDNIYALETGLYSNEMGVAGTVDCIAEFDGELSIIDFKNSRKPKTKSRMKNYFIQGSAYSKMAHECAGLDIKQTVIIIANWDGSCTATKVNTADYMKDLWGLIAYYNENLNT